MKLRDFLKHRIPTREIIRGDYKPFKRLVREAEKVGVIIRHGYENLYQRGIEWSSNNFYNGDESYPSKNPHNLRHIPSNYKRLYVVNCKVNNKDNVIALPKGIYIDQHPWRIKYARPNRPKEKLVYCNFSLGGQKEQLSYRQRREEVYESLRDKTWITFENMGNRFGTYDLTQLQYYNSTSKHMFTISPEGNGVDCHRTWEALYLKSIPIVQTSKEMKHFKDLPILFTKDYSELTPEYLRKQYNRVLDTEYNIEKLYLSYWRRAIENDIRLFSPYVESRHYFLDKILRKVKRLI